MTTSPARLTWGRAPAAESDPRARPPAPVGVPVVFLAVNDDPPDDPEAEGEEGQVPPWVAVAHRQERSDRAEAAADDPNHPTIDVAGHQREAPRQLDHPEDDQHPAERVQVGEDVPRVIGVEVRVGDRADPVDDVERPHDQQEDRGEYDSTCTSQLALLSLTAAAGAAPPPAIKPSRRVGRP